MATYIAAGRTHEGKAGQLGFISAACSRHNRDDEYDVPYSEVIHPLLCCLESPSTYENQRSRYRPRHWPTRHAAGDQPWMEQSAKSITILP